MEAQIQHLTILLGEQKSSFEVKESNWERIKLDYETRINQMQTNLDNAKAEKTTVEKEMGDKCKELQQKLEDARQEKEKAY